MVNLHSKKEEKNKLGPPKKKRKRRYRTLVESRDDGEGNWLVSFADLMTLLLAFFVILAAFSTPDPEKFERLRRETLDSLGIEYKHQLSEIRDSLYDVLEKMKLKDQVAIVETLDGLKISSKGTLFFDSGSVALKPQAAFLMNKIAEILVKNAKNYAIFVEGHTDNVPMVSEHFPSNWELSSHRAGVIVRLLEVKGFLHKDLRPVGLADTEPLVPNIDVSGKSIPINQAKNRRIVIRIKKKLG